MGKILQDIWIFTESGISVFKRVFDPKQVDEQRFAMFMSAINSFADKVYEGGISNFEISNKKFNILKQFQFLFIANSAPKVKSKKVLNELETIAKKFFDLYPIEVLENWNGDLALFDGFDSYIKGSVQNINHFMDMI